MIGKMKEVMKDVADFHRACDVPILESPQWPEDRIQLRKDILAEEFDELFTAIDHRDMIETADALGDLVYVAVGTALEFGIPFTPIWDEIQRSNMTKVDPKTGKVKKRDDGKVLKGPNFSPPDIVGVLNGKA